MNYAIRFKYFSDINRTSHNRFTIYKDGYFEGFVQDQYGSVAVFDNINAVHAEIDRQLSTWYLRIPDVSAIYFSVVEYPPTIPHM